MIRPLLIIAALLLAAFVWAVKRYGPIVNCAGLRYENFEQ